MDRFAGALRRTLRIATRAPPGAVPDGRARAAESPYGVEVVMSMRELMPWRSSGRSLSESEHPLLALQREMDALFSEFARTGVGQPLAEAARFLPPTNVSENAECFRVTAELPGMDLKDVSVRLEGGALVLSGKKEGEKEEKGRDWYRKERTSGEFRRVIQLPDSIDESKVAATFAKGVLTVDVPKSREAVAKSRVVEVKAS